MTFRDPYFFLLLFGLIPLWYLGLRRRNSVRLSMIRPARLQFSVVAGRHLPLVLRSASLVALAFVLARPQATAGPSLRKSDGLDIILAIDSSGSMRAIDFTLNGDNVDRLAAVKHVINNFVKKRPQDRIGMVVFGSEAYTQAPLTLDHSILLKFLEKVRIGIAGESTAIGDAIATATNRIKDVEAKSKVIILLTDGRNSAGSIDPSIATEAAASLGVRIYTIGVGKDGQVPIPVKDPWGRTRLTYQEMDLDEELLADIAKKTSGQFYRAYNTDSLEEVYGTIDKLETSKIEVKDYRQYEETYAIFLWSALVLFLMELVFSVTKWRSIP